MKRKFIFYGQVTTNGCKRLFYKQTLTTGRDPIAKDTSGQTATDIALYVKNLVEGNSYIPFAGSATGPAIGAVESIIDNTITSVNNLEVCKIKVGIVLITTGADAGKPGLSIEYDEAGSGNKIKQVFSLI